MSDEFVRALEAVAAFLRTSKHYGGYSVAYALGIVFDMVSRGFEFFHDDGSFDHDSLVAAYRAAGLHEPPLAHELEFYLGLQRA